MVDIFSKRDGPRREDAAARHLIEANRDKITRLADQLTSGGYSAGKAAQAAPAPMPEGRTRFHVLGSPQGQAEAQPYVRISVNNRVVVADAGTGRQLHFLGELRRRDGQTRFVMASAQNGFFSPLDPELASLIADLDGRVVDRSFSEKDLALALSRHLGVG